MENEKMRSGEEAFRYGKSVLVPSVQELAKASIKSVPERYVQPNKDHPLLPAYDDDLQVPIIDMDGLISGDQIELQRFHSACQDWGFFQLINHGVSPSLIEKFKLETQQFFELPMEEKRKFWQTPTDVEGFGQAFVVSDDQKLDWADIFFLTTRPEHRRRPNLFPKLPTPFRDTMEIYSAELEALAVKILECMAKALEIEVEAMKGVFGEGLQSMRMNYYPLCPQPEKVIGLTPHSDAVGLTILLQLNEMEGLQILYNGQWVPVKPLPNAFVVNIGDILEIITNGIYRSVLHRAVVNASKERLSVATFYNPSPDREIGPIPHLVTTNTPARFRNISMVDFLEGLFARALDRKSYLDSMRITKNDEDTTS